MNDNGTTNGGGGTAWRGMTFTPTISHKLQVVKLKLLRTVTAAGNFIVSIRATSNGLPTGSDLGSGSIPVSDISGSDYAVYSITLSADVTVNAGTQYAIVWRAPSLSAASNISIREKDPSTDYPGGEMIDSSNSGVTWSNNPTYDVYFEEWGVSITTGNVQADVNGDGNVNVLDIISVVQHWNETGTNGWIIQDVNQDGIINVLDVNIIGQNWTG
jgi:hypothetical protein